jgi:hypothetical protein
LSVGSPSAKSDVWLFKIWIYRIRASVFKETLLFSESFWIHYDFDFNIDFNLDLDFDFNLHITLGVDFSTLVFILVLILTLTSASTQTFIWTLLIHFKKISIWFFLCFFALGNVNLASDYNLDINCDFNFKFNFNCNFNLNLDINFNVNFDFEFCFDFNVVVGFDSDTDFNFD